MHFQNQSYKIYFFKTPLSSMHFQNCSIKIYAFEITISEKDIFQITPSKRSYKFTFSKLLSQKTST